MVDPVARSSVLLRRAPTTHTVEVGDQGLVVDRASGAVHRLDAVAMAIWQAIGDGSALDDLVAELSRRSGETSAAIAPGVASAVRILIEDGLVDDGRRPSAPGHVAGAPEVATHEVVPVPPEGLPEGLLQRIGEDLVRDAVAVEVVNAFRSVGVESILLKGPTFALWLYERGERSYLDIDLLVSPEDVGTATATLVQLGFEPEDPDLGAGRRWDHALPWRRASDGVGIDLHSWLVGVEVPPAEAWTILRARREPFLLLGATLDALDHPARLLHVCLHLAQDQLQQGKKLCDLERALDVASSRDWRAAAGLAADLGAEEAMGVGLRATTEGAGLAASLGLPEARDPMLFLRSTDVSKDAIRLLRLLRAGSVGEALRYGARLLFPPADYLRRAAPFPVRGRAGLVRAYLHRPFSIVRRGLTAIPRLVAVWWRLRRPGPGADRP